MELVNDHLFIFHCDVDVPEFGLIQNKKCAKLKIPIISPTILPKQINWKGIKKTILLNANRKNITMMKHYVDFWAKSTAFHFLYMYIFFWLLNEAGKKKKIWENKDMKEHHSHNVFGSFVFLRFHFFLLLFFASQSSSAFTKFKWIFYRPLGVILFPYCS